MFEPHVKYDIQETRRTARQEGIEIGQAKGIEIGQAKGIEIGQQDIVRRLKKHGIAAETITAVMEDKD